jgi:hypothetical protein
MAIRTQIRLPQITGSFGDAQGKIVDNLAVAATLGAIPDGSGSMVSAMSQLASSIQRIHGGAAFTSQAEGVFAARIQVDDTTNATTTDDGSLQTDGGLSVKLDGIFGNDLHLLNDAAVFSLGAGKDITITHDNGTGATLASAGAFVIDGADAVTIDSEATLTIGSAILNIDADGGDGAGLLSIDTNDTTNGITIGTGTSAVPIQIGHGTSEVTIGDNLTVTGDLTVSGATVTLDTTNLLVQDPIIVLNKDATGNNNQGGIAIEQGKASGTGDMVFGRVDDDTWGVGTKDTSGGTVTTVADMALGALRGAKIELGDATNHVAQAAGDLTVTADANLHLDAATAIKLDAGANQPIKMQTNAADLLLFALSADPRETGNAGTKPAQIKSYAESAGLEFAFGNTSALVVSGTAETGLVLSASGGKAMTLESGLASGVINFTSPGQTGGPGLSFNFGTDRNAKIQDDQGEVHIQIDSANTLTEFYQDSIFDGTKKIQFAAAGNYIHQRASNVVELLAPTVEIDGATAVDLQSPIIKLNNGTDDPAQLRFLEDGSNGSHYVGLRAPAAMHGDGAYTLVLPAQTGLANTFLRTDGSNNLSFAAVGSAAGAKHIKVLSASLATGDRLSDSVDVANFAMDAVSADNSLKAIDVFVNGQLLQSSSDAFGALLASSPGDYAINTDNLASSDVKFTFDLEADDTVVILVRP